MFGTKILIFISPFLLMAEAQYGRFGGPRPSSVYGHASAPMDTLYGHECQQPNGYHPNPTRCDSYIECNNYRATANRCPDGLHYTPNAQWPNFPCNYPWLQQQNNRYCEPQVPPPCNNTTTSTTTTTTTTTTTPAPTTTTTTTMAPTTTTTTTTAAPAPKSCCQCQQPNSYSPVPTRCDSYCECKSNVPTQFECPRGLVYNPSAQWPNYPCGYPSQGRCGSGRESYNSNPTLDYVGRYVPSDNGRAYGNHYRWQEDRAPAGFTCPSQYGRDERRSYRYQNSCSKFVSCQNSQPHLFNCDAGLAFDDRSESCVDSRHVSNCYP